MKVKVSVIIPVYNEEKYLRECLESVINQTLREIEIICVDDGSTDHSVQVIKKYCDMYSWIRLIVQENQGAGVARNRAMAQAQGQFVCFLDADDYYISEHALETIYNTAVEEKADICAGLLQTEFKGNVEKDPVLRELLKGKDKVHICYKDFQFDYQYQCYLFERNFLNKYEIEFPDYKRFQDPPFLVQALFYAEDFVVVRTELYFYRSGRQGSKFTDEKTYDLLKGLLFNLNFAKEHGLEKLFKLTLGRINQDYFEALYEGLERHIQGLQNRFMEARNMVTEMNLCFEPLELYLMKTKGQCSSIMFHILRKKIERNTDLIVYGAGDIGKKCVLYLENLGYANVVMWVDHYKCGEICFSRRLHDLEDIVSVPYDKILIAVKDCIISNQIKQELLQRGILKGRILEWCSGENREKMINE